LVEKIQKQILNGRELADLETEYLDLLFEKVKEQFEFTHEFDIKMIATMMLIDKY